MPKRQRESGRSQRGDGERPPKRSRSDDAEEPKRSEDEAAEEPKRSEEEQAAPKRSRKRSRSKERAKRPERSSRDGERRQRRSKSEAKAAEDRPSRKGGDEKAAKRSRKKGGDEKAAGRSRKKGGDKEVAEEKASKGRRRKRGEHGKASKGRRKGERKPPGTVERAITRVLAILGALLVGVGRLVGVVLGALSGPANAVRRRIARWVAALSRVVTPTRGLLLAALGCALLLGLSQFVDYRGISIGADVYEPGISAVAPAPEVDRKELGTAHGYAMVPIAIVAALILLFAARTGRWKLCRLAMLIGIAAIAVAILVDRPAGLDVGNLNRDFTGVEAKLLGGFWMQIFAGLGLAFTSFLLGNELKRADAPAKRRRPSRRKPEPESRRRRPRTRPKAEGAGA